MEGTESGSVVGGEKAGSRASVICCIVLPGFLTLSLSQLLAL